MLWKSRGGGGICVLTNSHYRPGQALGNPETLAAAGSSTSSLPSTSSLDTRLVEPITINIKPNYKAGLGLDSLLKEKKVRMVETAHYKEKVGIEEFVHRKRKHVDTKLVAK